MRYEDLPPALRRQVDAQLNRKPRKPHTEARGSTPGHCGCGLALPSYAAFERHCDAEGPGHRRWCIEVGEAHG